jgi:hypothetical protein
MASALAAVIDRQKLYAMIQGKKHVTVEGWTTLASMLGVVPLEVENADVGGGVYVAVVELRKADGTVLGRASAECGGDADRTWGQRDAYARRSMAATRATSKACRLSFSWIMTLAGYAATPAEEMDLVWDDERRDERHHTEPAWTGDSFLTFGKNWKGQKKWKDLKENELLWITQNMDPNKGPAVKFAKQEIARRVANESDAQGDIVEAEAQDMFK